jgi:hypothetical protein
MIMSEKQWFVKILNEECEHRSFHVIVIDKNQYRICLHNENEIFHSGQTRYNGEWSTKNERICCKKDCPIKLMEND